MECQDCTYFIGDINSQYGMCRRFPPSPHGNDFIQSRVWIKNWCGEFKKKEK